MRSQSILHMVSELGILSPAYTADEIREHINKVSDDREKSLLRCLIKLLYDADYTIDDFEDDFDENINKGRDLTSLDQRRLGYISNRLSGQNRMKKLHYYIVGFSDDDTGVEEAKESLHAEMKDLRLAIVGSNEELIGKFYHFYG